jgi:CheY-like chemotaxis protein
MPTEAGAKFRILVVEDDVFVVWSIEDALMKAGCEVAGTAATVAEAMRVIETQELDGAVLDLRLDGGELVYPLADLLHARHVPFVFVTGYGPDDRLSRYAGCPVLRKPFGTAEFRKALAEAIAGQHAIL